MSKLCMRLAVLLCCMAAAGPAFAEGFALYEYSARGIALGGAVMARKADPSAVAYNPALLTKLPGIHIQAGVSAITPNGKMKTTDASGMEETTDLRVSTWVVPNLYYTQQLSESVFVGVGEFSRFGLGFEYPHDWPGKENVYEVGLTSASLNPNIAWAATDKLSLAAGVEVLYVNLDLKKRKDISVDHPAFGHLGTLEVDSNIQNAQDIGVGFNLAGHYQFNDQWAAGLMYRSQVEVKAKGDVQYSNMGYTGNPLGRNAANAAYDRTFEDGDAHATVVLPDSISGGIAWTPIPELSIEAGAIWTRWSSFRSLRIYLPDPINVSESHKQWDDSWRFNVGVEYEPLDWLVLRAGYVYDQSPMTERYEDYLVPTDGRNIYSLGVGFKWDAWTADVAYGYIDAKGRSYSARPEDGVLESKAQHTATSIVSFSIGYEF